MYEEVGQGCWEKIDCRENHEGPIVCPAMECGLCRDDKNDTNNSLCEFLKEMPFGWYVFLQRKFQQYE